MAMMLEKLSDKTQPNFRRRFLLSETRKSKNGGMRRSKPLIWYDLD